MDELINHFNNRSKDYDQGIWVADSNVIQPILSMIKPKTGMNVLDLGAGTGVVLRAINSSFANFTNCFAVDISSGMLNMMNKEFAHRCIGDAHSIPFKSSVFDVCICRQSLHYMKDLHKVLGDIHRILSNDGALIIGQITPFGDIDESYWIEIVRCRQPSRKNILTLDELISAIKQFPFKIVRIIQICAPESLNSWLSRYSTSKTQLDKVRDMHYHAPEEYKLVHNFREENGDVIFDNCWTFVKAMKISS